MKTYGMTDYQISSAKNKLNYNKEFMHHNGIQLDNKIIPYADFVANSYMNADRYIAEIQHRAWSIQDYAISRNLSNVFITLTLPSVWHKKKTFKDKLVNNRLFGGRTFINYKKILNPLDGKKYLFLNADIKVNIPFLEPIIDFSNTVDKYTPRNASKELSKLLKKFFDDRAYKSIDKADRCYFRVTEPHKDGTPHLHISLFVPQGKKDIIVNSLNRLFPAPQSKIETDVDSPVHYLMKYVLKTFDDLRDSEDDISNLTLWYLYHGISRFYTSRTFVSLEIYRSLKGMYGLEELSEKYYTGDINVYYYSDTNKIALIENEFGTIYTPKPVNWSDDYNDEEFTYLEAEYESIYQDKEPTHIPVDIDGQKWIYYNGRFLKQTIKPYQMKDLQLMQYFNSLDMQTVNPSHYAYTHNIMVERGLIDGGKVDLSDAYSKESEVF